jgi:hypothetical protein
MSSIFRRSLLPSVFRISKRIAPVAFIAKIAVDKDVFLAVNSPPDFIQVVPASVD